MKTTETIQRDVWTSTIHPTIKTHHPAMGEALEWADANPIVWKIILGVKSKLYGKHGHHYMGCETGEGGELSRVNSFRRLLEREGFHADCARFTLAHYGEKGFRTGFFQQFDGTFPRGCAYVDYTPALKEKAIDRFLSWCDSGFKYGTREVWIDKKVVRVIGGPLTEKEKAAAEKAGGL